MKKYNQQLFQPFSCEDLFDLVVDIESYPQYVPGWQAVRVLERGPDWLHVEQRIGLGPARLRFTSRATFERPASIRIESSGRPFSHLRIEWSFSPRPGGSLVEFSSSLEMTSMRGLSTALLEMMGSSVISAFKRRAASRLQPLEITSDHAGAPPTD